MKQTLINLGIKVPAKENKYHLSGAEKQAQDEFFKVVIEKTGLPKNWSDYLRFEDRSENFIVLQESYRTYRGARETFRRFNRKSDATITQEAIDKMLEYIADKVSDAKQKKDKEAREKNFKKSLLALIASTNTKLWELTYVDETKGLRIGLKYKTEFGHYSFHYAFIKHSGTINPPKFYLYTSNCDADVATVEEWLAKNKPTHELIMAKANEIKGKLPTEFFVSE